MVILPFFYPLSCLRVGAVSACQNFCSAIRNRDQLSVLLTSEGPSGHTGKVGDGTGLVRKLSVFLSEGTTSSAGDSFVVWLTLVYVTLVFSLHLIHYDFSNRLQLLTHTYISINHISFLSFSQLSHSRLNYFRIYFTDNEFKKTN
jgi:hypothetical protein